MRLITDVLRDIRKGRAVDLASRLLAETVRAVQETGKKGSVTIELVIEADAESGVIEMTPKVKCKRPEPDIGAAVFFATASGDLLREDPRQKQMFEEAEAGDRRTGNA